MELTLENIDNDLRPASPPTDPPNHATPPTTTPTPPTKIDWFSAPDDLIDVGHSRVAHRAVGTGPDVLFVHGWPLHGATFRGLCPYLSDSFTCHFIDLPGTGFSQWDAKTPISVLDHAQTVRDVVGKLGLKKYALVGHDSGATIARWAAVDDDRVAGMVMGNTEMPAHHPLMLQALVRLGKLPGGAAILAMALGVPWLRRTRFVLGGCFQNPRFADGDFNQLFIEPMLRSRRTAAGQLRLLAGFDWNTVDRLADAHRGIRAPVQLLWGDEDPWFPLSRAKSMLSQFPEGAELKTIKGAKLLAHEDFAESFAGAMRPFLQRCLRL